MSEDPHIDQPTRAQIEAAADRRLEEFRVKMARHLEGWSADFRVLCAALEKQKALVRSLQEKLSATQWMRGETP